MRCATMIVVALAGCAAWEPGPNVPSWVPADPDPGDECLLDELDLLAEAYPSVITYEDGVLYYLTGAKPSTWCADGETVTTFVVEWATVGWEACEWFPASDPACHGVPEPTSAVWRPEVWTCATGHGVQVGHHVTWSCQGSEVEGSSDHTLGLAWELVR